MVDEGAATDPHGTSSSMVPARSAMVDEATETDLALAPDRSMVGEATEIDPAFTIARWIPVSAEDPNGCIQTNFVVSAPSWAGLGSWYTKHILELDRRSLGWALFFINNVVMENIIRAKCSPRERAFFSG
jgi:hypothetical protein